MIPGEYAIREGKLTLNEGRKRVTLIVANAGDRPIQVGSHYHFYETNSALEFDREVARARPLRRRGAVRRQRQQRRDRLGAGVGCFDGSLVGGGQLRNASSFTYFSARFVRDSPGMVSSWSCWGGGEGEGE